MANVRKTVTPSRLFWLDAVELKSFQERLPTIDERAFSRVAKTISCSFLMTVYNMLRGIQYNGTEKVNVVILNIFVQCGLEDEIGREKLKDWEVSSLEGEVSLIDVDCHTLEAKRISYAK